jgi:two-component system chemotaxis response regulator CheY
MLDGLGIMPGVQSERPGPLSLKKKILIVDDSSFSRRTLRAILEELSYTVADASDGATGLESFALHAPDLVILDLVMPDMYGHDVLKHLIAMNATCRVLIATSDVQSETAEKVKLGGAKGLVNKPYKAAQIAMVVGKILEGKDVWSSHGRDPLD